MNSNLKYCDRTDVVFTQHQHQHINSEYKNQSCFIFERLEERKKVHNENYTNDP